MPKVCSLRRKVLLASDFPIIMIEKGLLPYGQGYACPGKVRNQFINNIKRLDMSFTRSDLVYGYKWTARADHDNPSIRGGNDRRLLNREEGYEVLAFINGYMQERGLAKLASFRKIEQHLRTSRSGSQTHSEWKAEITRNVSF